MMFDDEGRHQRTLLSFKDHGKLKDQDLEISES